MICNIRPKIKVLIQLTGSPFSRAFLCDKLFMFYEFKSVRKVTNQVSLFGDHCVLIVSLCMTIGPCSIRP